MRIEMDHRHRPVGPIDRPQQRQRNRVITPESDDPRKGGLLQRRAGLVGVRLGLPRQDAVVAFFDLAEGVSVVVRGDGNIAAVDHFGPAAEGIGVEGDIVSSADQMLVRGVVGGWKPGRTRGSVVGNPDEYRMGRT